jgi:hypothetical protein
MVPPFYHLGFYSNHSLDDSYYALIPLEDLEKEKRKPQLGGEKWEVGNKNVDMNGQLKNLPNWEVENNGG